MSHLSKFAGMWDGSLGKITSGKYHTGLQPDSRAAFQHHYGARLRTREHETRNTKWTLKEDAIEPEVTDWASPVCFVT